MNYIIDTHTFLWAISEHQNLSDRASKLIENRSTSIYLSIASLWEMSIKISIGKLELEEPFEILIPRELYNFNIEILSIKIDHLVSLATLPLYHRDPFDRLIISQSIIQKFPIIGQDNKFEAYGVDLIW